MNNDTSKYPAIEKLKKYFENNSIAISGEKQFVRSDLFFVDVSINQQTFKILIEDEYGDFSNTNALINRLLVLISLKLFNETEDILEWSKELNISPSTFLEYYKSLSNTYQKIESLIGKIDPYISFYDYYNRTGIVRALLKQ